jgi:hypothetical protein
VREPDETEEAPSVRWLKLVFIRRTGSKQALQSVGLHGRNARLLADHSLGELALEPTS